MELLTAGGKQLRVRRADCNTGHLELSSRNISNMQIRIQQLASGMPELPATPMWPINRQSRLPESASHTCI